MSLVCGNKGSSLPPTPNPLQQARGQIAIERERARLAQEAQDAQNVRTDAAATKAQGAFDQDLSGAYNRSLGYAQQRVGEKGLNWDEFAPLITGELNGVKGSIPRLGRNPGSC